MAYYDLDEVDFHKGADASMTKSKVMTIYRAVKRRMESRYLNKGKLPGILFIVSSKKSDHDFIEQYVATQKDNPNMYVVDEPLWRIKPSTNYSGETFKIGVGNKIVKSRILKPDEDIEALKEQGYERIIDVPVEHRQAFELDIDSAMMDIAGISCVSSSKFISYDRLVKNPMKSEILTIGMDDNLQIKDFLNLDLIDKNDMAKPGFIHLDTSLTGDRTGFTYVVNDGVKKVDRYRKDTNGNGATVDEDVLDVVYKQVISFAIQAPNNSEISFEKTREFIYYLRNIGFSIRGISADGFQSADTIQLLKNAGFNASYISLDRTPDGYYTARTAIYEERVNMLNIKNTLLENELINVEQSSTTGKVDHPDDGSKDEADSLVGAIYAASKDKRNLQQVNAPGDAKLASEVMRPKSRALTLEEQLLGLSSHARVYNDSDSLKGVSKALDNSGIIIL